LGALIYASGGVFIYRALVASIETREASELSLNPGAKLAILGFATGFALCCTVVGLLWLMGAARLTGGDTSRLAAALAAALMASVGEELLFRGVLFRILEQALGTLMALLGSALLFGLAHMLNPSATLIGSLIIAVEAGLMLGMAFVATRNIWFPMGIHLAWNFTQGGIFGASGSATASPSLVQTAFAGPDWLTGGVAGTENSIITVTFCIVLVIIFVLASRRRNRWEAAKFRLRVN
jgi:membrane protease YdiL (CAAX protease family)